MKPEAVQIKAVQTGSVQQKPVEAVLIPPPPESRKRSMSFARTGEKKTRYSAPNELTSSCPVGYRQRVALTKKEAQQALQLLSLTRPTNFVEVETPREEELFEESSLGVMTARQSTNYRGHEQISLGPKESALLASLLEKLNGREAAVLSMASYSHVVISRPYRTPFTMLLTLVGHKPFKSLLTVPKRILKKKLFHVDDIPTIGYLQQLHLGILADAMERATVIASGGKRKAQVYSAPFCDEYGEQNQAVIKEIENLCGIDSAKRSEGWRISLIAQVGVVSTKEQVLMDEGLWRKIGANMMAFRSERIQPGINHEESAPAEYHGPQEMDVPEALTVQAGRAAYNAYAHWTGCDREKAKDLLMLERIDVLTPAGEKRIGEVKEMLNEVTDHVMATIPKWIDLPAGKLFSRSAERGKKAFGLAGQRVYIGGLSREEIRKEGIGWDSAVRAVGAAAARSGLVAELMGVAELPEGCDLLAGLCLMAGPINQNDIGKEFYGQKDLLHREYGQRDPTSLLVWTLKAKTVADPIGNEEQLMNPKRKGQLVDLRPGPHEVVTVLANGESRRLRDREGRINQERAFGDVDNFVCTDKGEEIPGNRGAQWPNEWRKEKVW